MAHRLLPSSTECQHRIGHLSASLVVYAESLALALSLWSTPLCTVIQSIKIKYSILGHSCP